MIDYTDYLLILSTCLLSVRVLRMSSTLAFFTALYGGCSHSLRSFSFSEEIVSAHSAPWLLQVASVWSDHQGSLLLWSWLWAQWTPFHVLSNKPHFQSHLIYWSLAHRIIYSRYKQLGESFGADSDGRTTRATRVSASAPGLQGVLLACKGILQCRWPILQACETRGQNSRGRICRLNMEGSPWRAKQDLQVPSKKDRSSDISLGLFVYRFPSTVYLLFVLIILQAIAGGSSRFADDTTGYLPLYSFCSDSDELSSANSRLNPLLQDALLSIHPPCIYFAYVLLALACSKVNPNCQGSTSAGDTTCLQREGAEGCFACRPKMLAPTNKVAPATTLIVLWAFSVLSLGLFLGSWWASHELGWGGWWFWDPVENTSLMPWIGCAAALHVLLKPIKHRKAWAFCLLSLSILSGVIGSFLIRSGWFQSVHAFAEAPTEWLLLCISVFLMTVGELCIFISRPSMVTYTRGTKRPKDSSEANLQRVPLQIDTICRPKDLTAKDLQRFRPKGETYGTKAALQSSFAADNLQESALESAGFDRREKLMARANMQQDLQAPSDLAEGLSCKGILQATKYPGLERFASASEYLRQLELFESAAEVKSKLQMTLFLLLFLLVLVGTCVPLITSWTTGATFFVSTMVPVSAALLLLLVVPGKT